MKRAAKTTIFLVFFTACVMLSLTIVDALENPKRVAGMLNITAPPQTLKVDDCIFGALTDVVITCKISVSPKEFPMLLKGYEFAHSREDETSFTVVHEKIGKEFNISSKYMAEPKEFEHGGFVTIYADKERRNAIVGLYIE